MSAATSALLRYLVSAGTVPIEAATGGPSPFEQTDILDAAAEIMLEDDDGPVTVALAGLCRAANEDASLLADALRRAVTAEALLDKARRTICELEARIDYPDGPAFLWESVARAKADAHDWRRLYREPRSLAEIAARAEDER